MMPQRLLNKVAVVTAGDGAVGRAIAERFLYEGAKVALFGAARQALEDVAQAVPARTLVVPGDAARSDDLQELVSATTRRFGPANVIVSAVNGSGRTPLAELTAETVAELFRLEVGTAAETVRCFLPQLADGASLLFLTSCRKLPLKPGWGAFLATQAALTTLAQGLAAELAPRGIRANCIAVDAAETSTIQPLDVAETAVFLASDASASITGQEIVVAAGDGRRSQN